jgi:hypothetical protein
VLEQTNMWAGLGIAQDFAVVKNRLLSVREQFTSDRFIHIGDTHVDAYYAEGAGFEFILAVDLARRLGSDGDTGDQTVPVSLGMTGPVEPLGGLDHRDSGLRAPGHNTTA